MQLTLEAFNKAKKTCEEFKSLEGLLVDEEYRTLAAQAAALYSELDKATNILASINEMRESLEQVGYSDAWYDTLLDSKKLEGIVQFNMPKFFDNNANRQQVCMEGFVESFAHWLRVAWENLKKFFSYIASLIHEIANWLGVKADRDTLITKALNKKLNSMVRNILTSQPLELEGWFNLDFIHTQLENVNKLMTIFGDDSSINRVFLNDGTDQINGDAAKQLFKDKLQTELDMRQIDYRDSDKNGFIVKYTSFKTKYIYFFNELGKTFPRENITIQSIEQFDALVNEVTEGKTITLAKQMSHTLGKINLALIRQRDKMQNLVNVLINNKAQVADPNHYTEAQCRVIQCGAALLICKDMMGYMREVYRAWLTNKSLVDNTLKMAQNVGAHP